eukprot:CAMPEP_0181472230 /NCGR_PEP_ID=MMETSP1110-20121109/39491_1 /TAXON_ID=174948 /ORGANISM="Symbiodinium sp., Strain CCMP421" /LENGTH=285 /DNA_ID=CAMNT_0023597289 /DNA_START=22 /DNA_END=876 /DNA_ORIENTATION=+
MSKPSLAKLLKHGIDPNALSFEDAGERRTLLCLAIEEAVKLDNDLAKVDLLLESRADPNRRSETGSFPLMLAARHSNVKLARKLFQAKAEVNQQDTKLVTSLHTAVHQDSAQMVQLLLMHKANVNVQDQVGQSPVFFAASTTVIAVLLDAKADLHHLNKKGQSALHLAAHNGRHEAVVYLTDHEFLQESVDLQDERGRSPLHLAAAQGHQRVVSRLMDVGANPKLKMHNGQTPMTLADKKDTDLALYIYTRMTGSKNATWGEMMQNPMFLTMAAVLGVACFVNRT